MKNVVSIAVLTPRSKSMLWMRRTDNQKWTLPGGHLEAGEDPVDGALRELWEETGIRAPKKDLKALGYDNVDDKYRVYAFTYTPDKIPTPTSENDPDGECDDDFLWFKDGELPESMHVPEAKNVTLNLMKEKPVAKSEDLQKMAIKDLLPGEPVEDDRYQAWDYSHLVPKDWQKKLALHLHQGNEMSHVRLVDLEDPDQNYVGNLTAYHGDGVLEPHSDLQDDYQGFGLGQAMYEAMYAHAYHKMGIRQVSGGFHTDAAGRVHEKLAAKHGLAYKKQAPRPTMDGNDMVRKPYSYALKTELVKSESDEQQAYNDYVNRVRQRTLDALQKHPAADRLWVGNLFRHIQHAGSIDLTWGYGLAQYIKEFVQSEQAFERQVDPELKKDLGLLAAHHNIENGRYDDGFNEADRETIASPSWMRPEDRLEWFKHRADTHTPLLYEPDSNVYRGMVQHIKKSKDQAPGEYVANHPFLGAMNSALSNKKNATYEDLDETVRHPLFAKYDGLHKDHVNRWINDPKTPDDAKSQLVNSLFDQSPRRGIKHLMERGVPVETVRNNLHRATGTYWTKLHPKLDTKDIEALVGDQHPTLLETEQQQALASHKNTPHDIVRQILTSTEDEQFDPDKHIDWSGFEDIWKPAADTLRVAARTKDPETIWKTIGSLDDYAIDRLPRHYKRMVEDYRNEPFQANEDPNIVRQHAHELADRLESDSANQKYDFAAHEEQNWSPSYRASDEEARQTAGLHPSLDAALVNKLAKQTNDPFDPVLLNPKLSNTVLKSKILPGHTKGEVHGFAYQAYAMRNPDWHNAKVWKGGMSRLGVPNLSTEKVRHLRDKVDSMGGVAHNKHLGNLPPSIKPFLNHKGELSSQQLQSMIDSVPSTEYWVGSPGYEWGGMQRHSDEQQDVFHVNYTDEHVRQMKAAGVWDTFARIQPQIAFSADSDPLAASGHPLGPTSIGWVRYNKGEDGIHIDEVQSDLGGARWAELLEDSGMDINQDHLKTIHNILWGNRKTANDLLGESFMHHLRQDPSNHGQSVHWPTYELKTKLADPPRDTYSRLPKELGFSTPGKYGELKVQDNTNYHNLGTMKSKVAKSEEDLIGWGDKVTK